MNFNLIDINHWIRKPYFEHYLNNVKCTYSMTANIEITDLLYEIKLKNIKFYPTLIYMIATVVNNHKEFRICFDHKGSLGYWDSMNPSYTIFHKENETFSSIWTEYNKSFLRFYSDYLDDIKNYGNIMKFTPKSNEPDNTFSVSSIPWVSFTGFNLNVYNEGTYLIPIFTAGKYFKQENKIFIPISIQVHHAICDGYHASRFINEMQELAFSFQEWLENK
ncbi:type A chloramphenicol O-acetyltransferase [Clostridium beijerinckii]|uniref:Chloramphenicol acetyltransferase n=1 Tax=Clostridium beijerinckii TaxID=1520 RepID=A0A1S9N4I4_CLOBE|nr:type A chloramphenicol O-acetyltransferase [Clostridium beijerinckii]MRY42819.1 type A chloramphenicol O-acetyltransferase [Parabacteroides distasonis]MZK53794.1 type A chloramphenicol O-acetyltransferase [Clostridium beijerinckii]MZK60807.1 type A chloramphenicol O-acetyltransferase [Clostridium beijerinckii]MZK72109.1 type A chloramphenicol O-acetyltransferase [Clostridium beijerinckii]MZK77525.1 type A chloramphenicol O-acetyltransferase [Clostridium beijerinckii]